MNEPVCLLVESLSVDADEDIDVPEHLVVRLELLDIFVL